MNGEALSQMLDALDNADERERLEYFLEEVSAKTKS